MWLINVDTITLEDFEGSNVPPYAILSHRWEQEEVLHQHILCDTAASRKGYWKILQCCKEAKADGLQYAWVDTCCIDKKSSAELSEAINSMCHWYAEAHICYVYLSDFEHKPEGKDPLPGLSKSLWFTRGWTLQELLAPSKINFYDQKWLFVGSKEDERFGQILSDVSGIPMEALWSFEPADWYFAEKMRWAAERLTTRIEDQAYCLLGLFGVHMPLLYGERNKAFFRLQEEIVRSQVNRSMLAWIGCSKNEKDLVLASSAQYFRGSLTFGLPRNLGSERHSAFHETLVWRNDGLAMDIKLEPLSVGSYTVQLMCDGINSLYIYVRKADNRGGYVKVILNGRWFFYNNVYPPCCNPAALQPIRSIVLYRNVSETLDLPSVEDFNNVFDISFEIPRSLAQDIRYNSEVDSGELWLTARNLEVNDEVLYKARDERGSRFVGMEVRDVHKTQRHFLSTQK